MTTTIDISDQGPDGISVSKWFAFYALLLAISGTVIALMLRDTAVAFPHSFDQFASELSKLPSGIKLLVFGVYISLCCTFLPLPATAVVAALATREASVGSGLADTVLIVASVGALASTIANLNDYHILTLIFRSRHVAKVRNVRAYHMAEGWFARSPFLLLVVFNFLPIPIDIVRVLATSHRYPRKQFAIANFLGRFIRYGIIAFATYRWNLGWIAPVAFLALAIAIALVKMLSAVRNRTPAEPNA